MVQFFHFCIFHRDIHILTVGTYTYTTDQRFQTAFHRDFNEWTLQIKWAQKRDAGMYGESLFNFILINICAANEFGDGDSESVE